MVDLSKLKDYAKNLSLLYVEDDNILREKTIDLLSCIFDNISFGVDGQDGLNKYKEKKYDMVITDINMPIMSGIEMIEEIKKINEDQIVIVTSAHDESNYLLELIKLGVENFVLKPIDLDQLMAILYKISKRLYDERNFEKNNQLLSQQSQFLAMGEMAGMIAHQWRQPLTSVSLRLYNLKLLSELGTLSDDETTSTVEECTEILEHLSSTLDTFRDFVKVDDDKSNFSIEKAITNTLDLLSQEIEDAKIHVHFNMEQDIVLFGVVGKFAQIILNIVNNSKDEFKTKDIEDPFIKIDVLETEELIILEFRDNAGGIIESALDKIFEPYFSTKSKNKSGLGLHTIKNIIELEFYGSIEAENIYNDSMCEGSLFRVKLKRQ
jgi:YesN/AraC family two-component response regulator